MSLEEAKESNSNLPASTEDEWRDEVDNDELLSAVRMGDISRINRSDLSVLPRWFLVSLPNYLFFPFMQILG